MKSLFIYLCIGFVIAGLLTVRNIRWNCRKYREYSMMNWVVDGIVYTTIWPCMIFGMLYGIVDIIMYRRFLKKRAIQVAKEIDEINKDDLTLKD